MVDPITSVNYSACTQVISDLPSPLPAATTIVLAGMARVTPAVGRLDLLLIGGLSLAPRGMMRAVAAALTGLGHVRDAALIEGIGAVGGSAATVILVFGADRWFGVL